MRLEDKTDIIIDMYINKQMTTVEIANTIGCSSSGVERLLKKNSVKCDYKKRMGYLSEEDILNICNRYIAGETTIEIGKTMGLCDRTIAKVLRKNNIELRRGVRRSHITNHSYFRSIDTPQKAYFLGWLISDGSVVRSKSRPDRSRIIALELQNEDKHILELFALELGADISIVKYYAKRNHYHMRFASEEMANDLEQYGVVPNKTWISYLPRIDDDLMPHLLRGIFDGDGTVTIDKKYGCPHFAFYGSEQICIDIRDYLHKKIGLNKNAVSKSTCYHVWWGGHSPSKKFCEYIYDNCGAFVLERKRQKFYNNTYHENTEITDRIS